MYTKIMTAKCNKMLYSKLLREYRTKKSYKMTNLKT